MTGSATNHLTNRRGFLKIAAAGTAAALSRPLPARAAEKTITILHESSFIKPFDEYVQNTLAPAYEKETGIKVVYEVTSVGSLPTRISTIAETGSGADITMNGLLQPFLFGDKYLDVGDIADEVGKAAGRLVRRRQGSRASSNGKWKAIPFSNIGQLMNWRTDWFAEVGVKKFPETWDELYEVGKKLKAKDHPFGFELGHGFGDNHGWLYPLLWSYGGAEVAADGKTVVIDSDETARAVDFARKFFKDTMLDDVLGWTDVSNNKAWMAEQISCTNNAESILWFAKREFPEIGKVTDQAHEPGGAEGALPSAQLDQPFDLQLLAGQGGGARLPALADGAEAAGRLVRHRPIPITSRCCTATTTRRCGMSSRATCPTATRSRARICRAGRRRRAGNWPKVVAKYVVVDMFAKACAGASTKDVIKNAEAQLKDIYRSA